MREAFTDWEQGEIQAIDESRQASDHEYEPPRQSSQVSHGLSQHEDLENGDDDDDRRQVTETAREVANDGSGDFMHRAAVSRTPRLAATGISEIADRVEWRDASYA